MASGVIEGMSSLEHGLTALDHELSPKALSELALAAVVPMQVDAKRHVQVATGATREHILATSKPYSRGAVGSVYVGDSGPNGAYRDALFLEYGTSKMTPRPFMRPAFERNKSLAIAIVSAGLTANLNRK